MRRLVASLLVLPFAACSPSAGSGSDDGGGGEDKADDADDPGQGYRVAWGPIEVQPGTEDTRCVTKRLGNEGAISVGQLHNELSAGSHHLIVYRLAEGVENDEPTPCTPFADVLDPSKGAPLGITQVRDETIALPEGVAFALAPDQLIRLEMHFLNAGTDPLTVEASSTFVEVPADEVEHTADFLFAGNPDIEVPAHGSATVGPSYLPVPEELGGTHVFAVTGHQHRWGTGVEVSVVDDASSSGTPVYQPSSFKWDEPPTVYHDPAFEVPSGGGFRFSCSYVNDSDTVAEFGESADDEMCFFWAYYYPSQGSKVCVHTDQLGGADGTDVCCPSTDPEDALYCALLGNL